jgi:DNA-binding transcriptional regulator YhcF (GntR family)
MTRHDIADYVGLTTETVSRTFTNLAGEGVIGLPTPQQVAVRDGATLEELAGDLG